MTDFEESLVAEIGTTKPFLLSWFELPLERKSDSLSSIEIRPKDSQAKRREEERVYTVACKYLHGCYYCRPECNGTTMAMYFKITIACNETFLILG